MENNYDYKPAPRKRPEIVRILIYVGILLASHFVIYVLQNLVFHIALQTKVLDLVLQIFTILLNVFFAVIQSVAVGLLAWQLVFRSKASPALPVIVLCVLNVIRSLVSSVIFHVLAMFLHQTAITFAQYSLFINIISLLLTWGVHALGYLIQRLGFYAKTLDTL